MLAERRIAPDLCAEVESLLTHDATSGESLTRRVSAAMRETLRSGNGPSSYTCGPYRLVQLLGAGGMGAVYLAERRDGEIEQQVAVKLLRADSDRPAWRDRFLRERQFLAHLNHASIARLLDAGRTGDGRPYLVMEYVRGVAIDEYAASLDLRAQLRLFLLVCEGVSHAHRHLIVHRDLKPANILVDDSGQPKLLDFGIAKLLDGTDETRTAERLLTPNYASPEQIRGDIQTTATDVYSLGAVLYKVLTGRSPRETLADASPAMLEQIAAPSRLNPRLPRDLDHILRKALRAEPDERYASVDAFADDLRAFLESRPVKARSGDAWYRTRRFLWRYRVAVIAVAIAIASLLLGVLIANQQRTIAQKRFLQVRRLANKVLALDQAIGGLDGSTKARQEIVAMSTEYLEALGAEARTDRDLALEVGEAYCLLARVQGVSFNATADQHAQAEESLRIAETFVQPELSAGPNSPKALMIAARISHHRTIIAQANHRTAEIGTHSRRCVRYLNRALELGELSESEKVTAAQLLNDLSLVHKNLHRYGEAIHYARRSIEVARSLPNPELRLIQGLGTLTNLQRLTGDLEGALRTVQEARNHLEVAHYPSDRVRRSLWAMVLSREGKVLATASGLSLGRPNDAIPLFQKAFHLIEEWTQEDPDDAWSRLLFATLGPDFGNIVRETDPGKALALYDHSLLRLREVKNNREARRGEAEVLAGSSYALRQLNRFDESRQRVYAAVRLLAETKDYPADRIAPHDPADVVLRAFAEHFAATGETQKASLIYQDLLDKIMMSKPDPHDTLSHAVALSGIYGALAALQRSRGLPDRGAAYAQLRLQLWRHWDRKLPGNQMIHRQLESAFSY